MRISDIFYSIQGEGELSGVPTVFVRTSGCNLRCGWCDTPYASWNPEGVEMSIEEILQEVNKHPTRFVVLTGGEPLVAKGIHDLAERLHANSKHITIETAGTVMPTGIKCDLASLSPKLSNSTPTIDSIESSWVERHEVTRRQPKVVSQWVSNYNYQLKFVFSDITDLAEIEDTILSIGVPIPAWKIQLMPQGISQDSIHSRQEMILAACREKGYRYCDRLHISLFGNKRGT